MKFKHLSHLFAKPYDPPKKYVKIFSYEESIQLELRIPRRNGSVQAMVPVAWLVHDLINNAIKTAANRQGGESSEGPVYVYAFCKNKKEVRIAEKLGMIEVIET